MIIEKKDIDSQHVQSLAKNYQIDLLTASILARREIVDPGQLKFFLEDDLMYLHSPFLFNQMEDAVERTLEAAHEGERVMVFGDRDVDGITSTVLLVDHLESMGVQVTWKLPSQDDPYGISKEAIEDFAKQDGTLIFTVDCGITATEEVAWAKSLGVDMIIIDHHIPGENLPDAYAIINPKVEDSGYPFDGLAGCAVTGKFIFALIFSTTQFYNQDVVLLHCESHNKTIRVEAVKLRNLVEIDSATEFIIPELFDLEKSNLYHNFLQGHQLFIFDKKDEMPLLEKAFRAEIHVLPIIEELIKFFPSLQGSSLLRLVQNSRSVMYQPGERLKETKLFVHLFSMLLLKQGEVHAKFTETLDLIAIGTIADMMPLVDENRILVRKGFAQIEKNPRPPLAMLLAKNKLLGRKITAKDIGWNISPVINATGRLGVPEVAVNYLRAKDQSVIETEVEELISINKRRRKLGDQAFTSIKKQVESTLKEYDNQILVCYDPNIERGVTGIIAARLMQELRLPVIIMTDIPTGVVGSARSPEHIHIKDFLSQFEELLDDFGGHPCAGGFSLQKENLALLQKQIKSKAKNLPERTYTEKKLTVDASIPSKYMTPEIMKMIDRLAPYGEQNAPLTLEVFGQLQDIKFIGNSSPGHIRISLKTENSSWPGVFWGAADLVGEDFSLGDSVRVVCRIGRNYFQQVEIPQLTIQHMNKV